MLSVPSGVPTSFREPGSYSDDGLEESRSLPPSSKIRPEYPSGVRAKRRRKQPPISNNAIRGYIIQNYARRRQNPHNDDVVSDSSVNPNLTVAGSKREISTEKDDKTESPQGPNIECSQAELVLCSFADTVGFNFADQDTSASESVNHTVQAVPRLCSTFKHYAERNDEPMVSSGDAPRACRRRNNPHAAIPHDYSGLGPHASRNDSSSVSRTCFAKTGGGNSSYLSSATASVGIHNNYCNPQHYWQEDESTSSSRSFQFLSYFC